MKINTYLGKQLPTIHDKIVYFLVCSIFLVLKYLGGNHEKQRFEVRFSFYFVLFRIALTVLCNSKHCNKLSLSEHIFCRQNAIDM